MQLSLWFLKRNLKTSNTNIKSQAYLSLVRPKLEYACSVLDPHAAEHRNKIEMVQRRVARYACNWHHNTSSITDILQTLTWPTLQQRRLKTKLIMFYKIVHHIVAVPTTILIPTDSRIRQFHLFTYRHLHANVLPSVRVMVFNTTFNNISVISWRQVLLVEETGVPGENHRPAASHWQTVLHKQDSKSQH
jgi:hypothetical protein